MRLGDEAQAKPIQEMAAWLHQETGFGVLPESWLLRCIKAVGGLDPRRVFSEKTPPEPEVVEQTRGAMLRVIKLLQSDAGFIHEGVLPYRFPLIILARFFTLHPDPSPRNRELLCRWIWRGALRAEHGNSSHAHVQAHTKEIGEDESGAVQRLLSRTAVEYDLPDPSAGWYGQGMVTRLHMALMLHHEPQDPRDGAILPEAALRQALEAHQPAEIFPSVCHGEASKAIASRVFLPRGCPVSTLKTAPPEVHESLLISEEAAAALLDGDEETFIQRRAQTLRAAMQRMAERYASSRDGDRPPLTAILAAAGA